ncbi:MAG TPA: hypothetical protein PLX89_18510 [Verrucomicrobiota bacterium]|nr:hypothetical protein [Verrucomicrobiota bacterium]
MNSNANSFSNTSASTKASAACASYCILSNHIHLLLEVPTKPTTPLTAEELIAKLAALSNTALIAATARQRLAMFRQANDAAGEREFINRLCATMWDVSGFMHRLKQRFTQWFNRRVRPTGGSFARTSNLNPSEIPFAFR